MEAEVDFGDVIINLAGELTVCYLFVFRLSYSGKAVLLSEKRDLRDAARIVAGHAPRFNLRCTQQPDEGDGRSWRSATGHAIWVRNAVSPRSRRVRKI